MQALGERILVAAFEGWSDAAEAATSAVEAIRAAGDYEEVFSVDAEAYFDYQYTRPIVSQSDGGERVLTWPSAQLWRPQNPTGGAEIWLLSGIEPARAWQGFTAEILDRALAFGVTSFVALGAMLTDAPHSRPIRVQKSSENVDLRTEFEMDRSQYEGPAGILTVMADVFEREGIPSAALWASVPHYSAAHSPSPKATLALLDVLGTIAPVKVPRIELARLSRRWEAGIDAAVADDPDLAVYVAELERVKDEWDSPEASGESLAREFERYLRKDGDGPQRP